MLVDNLVAATAMVLSTILVHFLGLSALIALMRSTFVGRLNHERAIHSAVIIVLVVVSIAGLHTLEIWMFAGLYLWLGLFDGNLMDAVYFSASTFSTVGFGDLVLPDKWRLLAATEGAHGFLLIGWSTAFMVTVTAKMGLLEARLDGRSRSSDPHRREGP